MHMVSYPGKKEIKEIINRDDVEKSMLTAYFEANKIDERARTILYRDFPKHYTWQIKGKFWQKRKKKKYSRLVGWSPPIQQKDNDTFYEFY
jgi:hypothetical protein